MFLPEEIHQCPFCQSPIQKKMHYYLQCWICKYEYTFNLMQQAAPQISVIRWNFDSYHFRIKIQGEQAVSTIYYNKTEYHLPKQIPFVTSWAEAHNLIIESQNFDLLQ